MPKLKIAVGIAAILLLSFIVIAETQLSTSFILNATNPVNNILFKETLINSSSSYTIYIPNNSDNQTLFFNIPKYSSIIDAKFNVSAKNIWIRNDTFSCGLPINDTAGQHTITTLEGKTILLTTNNDSYTGVFTGYVWNGTCWNANLTVSHGVGDLGEGDLAHVSSGIDTIIWDNVPILFTEDEYTYSPEKRIWAWKWNGTQWITNLTMNKFAKLDGTSLPLFTSDEYSYRRESVGRSLRILNISGQKKLITSQNNYMDIYTWNGTHWTATNIWNSTPGDNHYDNNGTQMTIPLLNGTYIYGNKWNIDGDEDDELILGHNNSQGFYDWNGTSWNGWYTLNSTFSSGTRNESFADNYKYDSPDTYPIYIGDVDNDGIIDLIEPNMSFQLKGKPLNPLIDISSDGDIEWNFTGSYSQTNNRSVNVSTEIIDYLSTCTADANSLCNIPITVGSTNSSLIEISDINITYNFNYTSLFNYEILNETIYAGRNATKFVKLSNTSAVAPFNINITGTYLSFNDTNTSTCTLNTTNYSISGATKYCSYSFIVPQSQRFQNQTLRLNKNILVPYILNVSNVPNTTYHPDNKIWINATGSRQDVNMFTRIVTINNTDITNYTNVNWTIQDLYNNSLGNNSSAIISGLIDINASRALNITAYIDLGVIKALETEPVSAGYEKQITVTCSNFNCELRNNTWINVTVSSSYTNYRLFEYNSSSGGWDCLYGTDTIPTIICKVKSAETPNSTCMNITNYSTTGLIGFYVPSFSSHLYSLTSFGSPISYCGNGICEGFEMCGVCVADCGVCSGGGGGSTSELLCPSGYYLANKELKKCCPIDFSWNTSSDRCVPATEAPIESWEKGLLTPLFFGINPLHILLLVLMLPQLFIMLSGKRLKRNQLIILIILVLSFAGSFFLIQ